MKCKYCKREITAKLKTLKGCLWCDISKKKRGNNGKKEKR